MLSSHPQDEGPVGVWCVVCVCMHVHVHVIIHSTETTTNRKSLWLRFLAKILWLEMTEVMEIG